MPPMSRRGALGTTVALCPLPALAEPGGAADTTRDAQTRQVIEAYARAWERGDVPALRDSYHADFTLNYFGRNALAGRHQGKAASLKVLGEMLRRTDRALKAIDVVMVAGDQAIMLTRETMSSQGQPVEVRRLYRYTVADGRLRECWIYDEDQRQLDEIIGT